MSQTADRYSKALFDLALEQKNVEAIQSTLNDIKKIIAQSEEFRLFLSNPLLDFKERCKVLKALFEGKIPELALRFLEFITFKSRLNILREIITSFDSLYLVHTHQIRAYIKTAFPLNDQDKNFINQHLQEKFKQQVLPQWILDESLIGGFRIFAQGKLYDYSFKDQLDSFYQQTT